MLKIKVSLKFHKKIPALLALVSSFKEGKGNKSMLMRRDIISSDNFLYTNGRQSVK